MNRSKLLTREEIADTIQVSLVKFDRMRKEGTAPLEMKIGRAVRFSQQSFDSWLKHQSAGVVLTKSKLGKNVRCDHRARSKKGLGRFGRNMGG